jgi:hypothetical protein
MANFRIADGLNELRGQQRVALDALGDHEARGDVTKPQCHRGNDEKAREGKPAHQIELRRQPLPSATDGSSVQRFFVLPVSAWDCPGVFYQPCTESV